ncbi:hypothetical protein D3Y57_05415 [Sphingomonas paeninsulae]|uniref:Uncharacterized protein n=1 Tax=Sphingomonas paeninsulae TaxID=2319844 RepID=A0A494T862_SPHPE|nr:hypothetical protein [Sphingomonas paeninsulae]AYJ85519.1 hypothetical protein D3Y57_05415 [Sphingomonas paeninsulae]
MRNGFISFTNISSDTGSHNWHRHVMFTEEVAFDTKAFDKDYEALKVAHSNLEETLILGDSSEAIELLKAFEAL